MNLDALVAPLRADVVSGATAVARAAADILRRGAEDAEAGGADELRDLLDRLAVRILDAQPAMAPLFHLGARVLRAAEGSEDLSAVRRHAVEAAVRFRQDLERSADEVARFAVEILPEAGRVVTLSASSTVAAALTAAARRGGGLEVVCLESRPMSEGRDMARRLADAGVPVIHAVDAAAWSLTRTSAAVLVGADSVGDRGVVNKIGSRALAAAARATGVPFHVFVDRTKLLPPGFPQPVGGDRPDEEVWKSPAGIRVWNRYFEYVETDLVESFVVEDGVLSSAEVSEARQGLSVPESLRAWAGGVPAGPPDGAGTGEGL